MRILFLNQFFPPDPAPTGALLREVADRMEQAGHTVDFVAARQDYRQGQGKGGRLWREARALGRMLVNGLRRPRADVVVSGTSPPCLLLVATLVAFWHRAKSVHWVMDVYPEIAIALGEIRDGIAAKFLTRMMGWAYRRTHAVVVLEEDMGVRLSEHNINMQIIGIWCIKYVITNNKSIEIPPETPWTWLYSGNLGRAHDWTTLIEAQAILEKRGATIRLDFQGGGPAWPAAQAKANDLGLRQCEWKAYVDEAELPNSLLRARVLVVTQLPEAQGLLWPSKLALVLSLPRPILWVGPTEGAIARTLRALPTAGIFAPGKAAEVADWLLSLQRQSAQVTAPAVDATARREAALSAWQKLLEQCQ